MNDSILINYSAIITYRNGDNRGYTIRANSQKEAFEKLMNHVNFDLVRKVEIAEIIVDEDMIKQEETKCVFMSLSIDT